jgi:hypothetical protein
MVGSAVHDCGLRHSRFHDGRAHHHQPIYQDLFVVALIRSRDSAWTMGSRRQAAQQEAPKATLQQILVALLRPLQQSLEDQAASEKAAHQEAPQAALQQVPALISIHQSTYQYVVYFKFAWVLLEQGQHSAKFAQLR